MLVGVYLPPAASSYAPAKTQDPCKPRPWRNPQGLQEIAEQFSLSALDGAACKLGVTRETLARALATPEVARTLRQALRDRRREARRAIRAGLLRAVNDAEEAGALSPLLAGPLRGAVERSRSTRRSN